MPDPRAQALTLLGIVDQALQASGMPWEHEAELGDLARRLDALELPPSEHPWSGLMGELVRQCRSLVSQAKLELNAADPATIARTETQRAKVREEADRLFALVDLESA